METVAIVIGLLGAAIVLAGYFLLSAGKISSENYLYPLMNLSGSVGVLISLAVQWNLSSFVINVTWVGISLVGIARIYLKRKRA